MIGILLVTHEDIGDALIRAAQHTLGQRPAKLEAFAVQAADTPDKLEPQLRDRVKSLNDGDGVLLLTDCYGATPANISCRMVERGQVEVVGGANLPMLLRAINYRNAPLEDVVNKAISGGLGGIVCGARIDTVKENSR
jgi:PTS system ascorbate-specific IIA component